MKHINLDALLEENLELTRQALRNGEINDYKANLDRMEIFIQSEPGNPYRLTWAADEYMTHHENFID